MPDSVAAVATPAAVAPASGTPAARAAILAKNGVVKPGAAPVAPVAAKPVEPKPTDATAGKTIADVARLSAENRALTTKLKAGEKPAVVTKEEYIGELRKNPGLIFKDISDDPELLVKLAEARNATPEDEARSRQDAEIKRLADELEVSKRTGIEREVYSATAQILEHGYEDPDGEIKIAANKWPLSQKLTKLGEIDAPGEAMKAAGKMVIELTGGKRNPTTTETAAILEIVFDQIEAREKRAGEVRRLEAQAEAKTNTSERPKNRPLSLVGAKVTGGHAPKPQEAPRNSHERRQERLNKLRQELATAARGDRVR